MILPGMPRPMMMRRGGGLPAGTTWNPGDKEAAVTLSSGNLAASKSGSSPTYAGCRATSSFSLRKLYWELIVGSVNSSTGVGIGTSSAPLNSLLGFSTTTAWGWQANGTIRHLGVTATISSYTIGDVLSIAVDMENRKLHFAKNGVWQASSDPEAATGGFDIASDAWFPITVLASTSTLSGNFNGPFGYSVPAGFNE